MSLTADDIIVFVANPKIILRTLEKPNQNQR